MPRTHLDFRFERSRRSRNGGPQQYSVSICCGGILGLGEIWRDRVKVDGIPLNVLLPVMEAADVAKSFAIFRLVNPAKMLKFAAGRETTMKDFQGLLMLAGMNSMITGGYLTTRGRSIAEDRAFLASLNCFISAGSGGQMQ